MVGRMVERGYDPDFAQRCFDQIKGFGEYGFPESHAASFAHLVYVSSWLKWKYPAAFACGAAQLAADGLLRPGADRPRRARAWRRGARGRCESQRLGLHAWNPSRKREGRARSAEWRASVRTTLPRPLPHGGRGAHCASACARSTGCSRAAARLVARRPYASVEELRSRGGVPVHAIQRLAAADAFRSMGLDRRAALWDSRALKQAPDLPLFAHAEARDEGAEAEPAQLPAMPLAEHVVNDYQTIRLSA